MATDVHTSSLDQHIAARYLAAGHHERQLVLEGEADAVQTFEAKANTLLAQANANRNLSSSLSYDDA